MLDLIDLIDLIDLKKCDHMIGHLHNLIVAITGNERQKANLKCHYVESP